MTYPDALSYLGQTRRFGMKLGLEPMRELARALGDPQESCALFIWPGRTARVRPRLFANRACARPAYRVGLYTSPHLVSVRERIQIDRYPISEADFAEGMTVVRRAAAGQGITSHVF